MEKRSYEFHEKGDAAQIRAKLDGLFQSNINMPAQAANQLRNKQIVSGFLVFLAILITFINFLPLLNGVISSVPYAFLGSIAFLFVPAAIYWTRVAKEAVFKKCVRLFDKRKIEIAWDLFSIIGMDIPQKAICRADIDSRGYYLKNKLKEKSSRGFVLFGNTRRFRYEDPWFSAAGKLHDGTSFTIAIEQTVKQREKRNTVMRWKRHIKIKTRSRRRSFHREKVRVSLRLDGSVYPGVGRITEFLVPGTSGSLTVSRISLHDLVLTVVAVTGVTEDEKNLTKGKDIVGLFVYIYRQLQKCTTATG